MNQIKFLSYAVIDIFFPNNCEICREHLLHTEAFICLDCKYNLPYIDRHELMVERIQKVFWGRVEIERVYSVYNYQKGTNTQKILHAIKYHNKTKLAIHMGEIMGSLLPTANDFDFIIPVPLFPKKLKQRGYNQSMLLAQGIEKQTNIPIAKGVMVRTQASKSQTVFSKYDRWDNVRSIFEVVKPEMIEGKHILLVDDVLTTGATIEACAIAALSKADCKISIATLAVRV